MEHSPINIDISFDGPQSDVREGMQSKRRTRLLKEQQKENKNEIKVQFERREDDFMENR